jgi:hypothetical protein
MFERYTERARRVIFFARYEASQYGSPIIESEHLLLGLLREDKYVANRFLPPGAMGENIRNDVTKRLTVHEKVSSAIDLPLSQQCRHILQHAVDEAQKLSHRHIANEHLLLGILREEGCLAAQVLAARGLKVESIREELARNPMPPDPGVVSHDLRPLFSFWQHHPALPETGAVPDEETAKKIAEAVWKPLFGPEIVSNQKPARAELKFDVWLVTGPENSAGMLFAYILRADGRILSVGRGPAQESMDGSI